MDAGFVDEEGFLYIMSRSDDVINVAGHRLSTGALEEVRRGSISVMTEIILIIWSVFVTALPTVVCVFVRQSVLLHPAVVDCAVVGLEDPLKGHVPLALCVLRNGKEWRKMYIHIYSFDYDACEIVSKCNVFSASLLQSSVSHDPSESL